MLQDESIVEPHVAKVGSIPLARAGPRACVRWAIPRDRQGQEVMDVNALLAGAEVCRENLYLLPQLTSVSTEGKRGYAEKGMGIHP